MCIKKSYTTEFLEASFVRLIRWKPKKTNRILSKWPQKSNCHLTVLGMGSAFDNENQIRRKKEQSIYAMCIWKKYIFYLNMDNICSWQEKALRTGLKNKWKLSGLRKMLPRTKKRHKNYCCEQKNSWRNGGWENGWEVCGLHEIFLEVSYCFVVVLWLDGVNRF